MQCHNLPVACQPRACRANVASAGRSPPGSDEARCNLDRLRRRCRRRRTVTTLRHVDITGTEAAGPWHAGTEGPQPKQLLSNANYDMRRMRRNRPQRKTNAPFVRALHVAFAVTNYKPAHVCTLRNGAEQPKGCNHTMRPHAECHTCKLNGHAAKDCAYANCKDVDGRRRLA